MWKTIKDYPNYEVSDRGEVRRKKNAYFKYGNDTRGKSLNKHIKNNYYQVCLRGKEGKKYLSIHRIVAQTFIPNPNNFPCINHKDENKLNNAVENLEWCTWSYNARYGTKIERTIAGHNRNRTKKAEQPVVCFKDGVPVARYRSISAAARELGVNDSCIRSTLCGKNKTCHGYTWKRERDMEKCG
jgi:hypothetical protein